MNESTPTSNKKNALVAIALACTFAAVGLVAPPIVRAVTSAPASTEFRASRAQVAPILTHTTLDDTTVDKLGDTTLDELAEALAEMGLAVEISPRVPDGTQPEVDPSPTSTPPEVETDDEPVETDDDPFAGMTDDEIDALSDEEFFAIIDEADMAFDDDSDNADSDDEDLLATFAVRGNKIDTSATTSELAAQAGAIWDRFAELVPAGQRQMVKTFELMSDEDGGAYVYATDEDPTKWVLGVGLGMGNELDYTLVHEFGHLLTLQAKEVPPGGSPDSCATYYTGEGCALSGSTFAGFVEEFWPQEMIDEINRIEDSGDWDAADAFYQEHNDEFVTDYATTNPGEDLAETFATFVMSDRPTGDTIADQKVQFLWNDPAMATLRNQIRSNL